MNETYLAYAILSVTFLSVVSAFFFDAHKIKSTWIGFLVLFAQVAAMTAAVILVGISITWALSVVIK